MSELKSKLFRELVYKKYVLYNSLFMELPYDSMDRIGKMLPLLNDHCLSGFAQGQSPKKIIDDFFDKHMPLNSEEERISFLFKIISYVERQVVLFDSIEDSSFKEISNRQQNSQLQDLIKIAENNEKIEELMAALNDYSVRIVFTAHPTQFYSQSVQIIIEELRRAILHSDIDEIDLLLQQLGKTSLVNKSKPTPLQEAQSIIYHLRHVYYDTIGDFYHYLKKIAKASGQDFDNPGIIELGFWPGGDRDGNPFVTSEITLAVARELRMTLMKCYYQELKSLRRRLSFKNISELLEKLSEGLYRAMFDPEKLVSKEDILAPLKEALRLLEEDHLGFFSEEVTDLIHRVEIFGTHFASLDIRQDHDVHKTTIEEILTTHLAGFESLEATPDDQLIDILLHQEFVLTVDSATDPVAQDTIRNIKQLHLIQKANGEKGCHRYIISNSEDIFSVLFPYALFRWCGYKEEDIHFDIVPLFETIKGMDASYEVMNKLFSLDKYEEHIARRDRRQHIMLGFSDGTKDGGYLKANLEIYNTKESLTAACRKNNVEPIFFDGRGGPPARGGGKTYKFYASKGSSIDNNAIHLTIQGQTITSMYGTPPQFTYNCVQLLTAGMSRYVLDKSQNDMTPDQRQLIQELADLSYQHYSDLKNHDQFIPYLEEMSTLKYYGNTKIGSRPSKRGNKNKLTLKDLRAISFVSSWSLLKQNVPGYYGIGFALKTLEKEGRFEEAKTLFEQQPFFQALLLNAMMSMTKTFFPLTSYMEKDERFGEFWSILKEEYDLTKQMIFDITGFEELMQNEPFSKDSIATREDIVRPLITIQQYALQNINENHEHRETYEKMVTRSLFGNINASRNSA